MDNSDSSLIRRASTQDVSWFIDINRMGQLNLSPSYQRKSVWTAKDRKFFLDTIFRGFPCPPVYLHKTFIDGKNVYAVVDGKQRIETILCFYNNKVALPNNFNNEKLDGKRWKDIQKDQALAEKFMNYVFPVEFINLPFDNSKYVNDVFDRLNRNAKLLNPQELRHARFDGWFIHFAEEEILDPFWSVCKISTRGRNRRMADVQFVSELIICVIKKEIIGFDQDFIDACYSLYDSFDDFDSENEWRLPEIDPSDIKTQFALIKNSIKEFIANNPLLLDILGDNKSFYSVWSYLVLSKNDQTIPTFSPSKYIQLITELDKLDQTIDYPEMDPTYKQYNDANNGATTEFPQRQKRFEAMKQLFEE